MANGDKDNTDDERDKHNTDDKRDTKTRKIWGAHGRGRVFCAETG
jgi:hypothetical protein